MENKHLSEIFLRLADALEIAGENKFKVLSYRKVAQVLEGLTTDISEYYRADRLRDIPGVGEGIEKKIKEYFQTGSIKKLEEVTRELSPELIGMLAIPSLGPKTLSLAYKKLKVRKLSDLEKAVRDGSLAKLPLMGERKIQNIQKGIDIFKRSRERMPLGKVYLLVEEVVRELGALKEVKNISPAGSFRRMKETIGDIDILIAGIDPKKIMEKFTGLAMVKRVLARGDTKSSILTREDVQVDLRVVPEGSWGAALQYFTGSKEHNVNLRGMARDLGLKINEYGVFKNERMIAGRTEEEVYQTMGMDYIPPELRENMGEIELAQKHKLPKIISYEHFPGEFHVHTNYSDGAATIEEMVKAGEGAGYGFIGLADHSRSAQYAGGLSEKDLDRRNREIDKVQKMYPGIRLLKGMEVDILSDGRLDYTDKILTRLDFVIVAIHSGLNHVPEERIMKAMDNPYVTMIAHPTGRLFGSRESSDMDMERIFKKAKEKRIAMEINAHYNRLDLNDYNCRLARKFNVRFAINTDSHSVDTLWQIRLGIAVARRAGLEKKDIVNYNIRDFLNKKAGS